MTDHHVVDVNLDSIARASLGGEIPPLLQMHETLSDVNTHLAKKYPEGRIPLTIGSFENPVTFTLIGSQHSPHSSAEYCFVTRIELLTSSEIETIQKIAKEFEVADKTTKAKKILQRFFTGSILYISVPKMEKNDNKSIATFTGMIRAFVPLRIIHKRVEHASSPFFKPFVPLIYSEHYVTHRHGMLTFEAEHRMFVRAELQHIREALLYMPGSPEFEAANAHFTGVLGEREGLL